jgi:hypothetical protein
MTLDGGGGEAVFGSFAAVDAASTTNGGGCRRKNVQGSCHDLEISLAHSSSMGIAAAVADCSSGQMTSGSALFVGFAKTGGSLAVI